MKCGGSVDDLYWSDAATVTRVETADETQLLAWSERILSAEKLEAIFQ